MRSHPRPSRLRHWLVIPALITSAFLTPTNARLTGTTGTTPASIDQYDAFREVLDHRAQERSGLSEAAAAVRRSLIVLDGLLAGDRPTAHHLQQAVLERLNLDPARERFAAETTLSRERLESLGMKDDAAALRGAVESIRPRLARISELLAQAAELTAKGSAGRQRLDGIVGRLRDELTVCHRLLADDEVRTTGITQEPLTHTSLDPVNLTVPVPSLTYTPEPVAPHLKSTSVAGLTQPVSIQDLAQQLGFNPLKIYMHVRNTFRFELYPGLLKGPQATMETGGGNDYDLAALTGALLEASGYTVRYVRGTAVIPVADMIAWLGLENAGAANTILNTAGIAATPVTVNSVLDHYRVDRIWVEVQAAARPGGDLAWFPLDTAFKRHDLRPGINSMPVLVPFNENGYLSLTRPELTYEYYRQQVRDYLLVNNPGLSVDDVPVGMTVIPETPAALPRSLPYKLFALGSTYSPLPDTLKHKARVRLTYQGIDRFSRDLILPDTSLSRLTLSYTVDPADQSIVDSYGGLFNTPAFLVDVIPKLKLDGVVVATATTIPYLATVSVSIDFTKPGPVADGTSTHTMRAGEWAAIGIDAHQISNTLLQRQADLVVAATRLEHMGGTPDPDELIGAMLYYEVMHHHQAVRLGEETSADLSHYRRIRGVSEGAAEATQQVLHLGGVPFTTVPGSLVLDVPRQIVSNFPLDNDNSDRATLLRVTGFNGSAQEHATWEELLNVPGISTIKSLQLARVRAVPIFVINNTDGNPSNDCSVLCPQLNLNPSTESAIIAEANSGQVVTVPRDPTPLNDWQGVGYLSENPSTGAAAYIISGGLNSAQSDGDAGPGAPGQAHGGAVTIILADGTILVVPAGLLGDALGSAYAGDPVNIANGNFFRDEIDFAIPALSEALGLQRVYNSQSTDNGPLGLGWAHNYGDHLIAQPGGQMIWLDGRGTAYTYEPDTGTPGAFLTPPGLRETLTTIAGGFRLTRFDGRVQNFDTAGRLVSRADRNNNTFTFLYDGSGRLQTVRDPVNRALTFGYNGAGKISSVSDFTGRAWAYAYDASNRLNQVTSPSDAGTPAIVTRYDYDTDGRIRTITEPNGGVRSIRYYANGRVAQVVDPQGYPMTLVYNPFKSETRVTSERGHTEIHTFNAAGNLVALTHPDGSVDRWTYTNNRMMSHTDALGGIETFEYDTPGNMIRTVDPTNRETLFAHSGPFSNLMKITKPVAREINFGYDGNGNVSSISDPETGSRTMVNNSRGLPNTVTDARLVTTTFTYENDGQVATRAKPLSFTETYAHNPRGTLASWTDANGNARTYVYDLLDRPITAVDADLHAEQRAYDAGGRLFRVTNARGGITQYEYDVLDRVTRVIHPDGSSRRLAYDQAGNLISELDELGRTTLHNYDSLNRNIRTRLPDGGIVQRAYDAAGRMVSTTDPRGNTTRYVYDAAGRLTRSTDALNHFIARTYDSTGNLQTVTDRRGAVTSYQYDKNLRVRRIDGASGRLETLDYDANGNEVDRTRYDVSGVGTIPPDPRTLPNTIKRRTLKSYDPLERLDNATDPGGGVTHYTYDTAGNTLTVTDPRTNTTTYAYTKTNLVKQVIQPDLGTTQIVYDAAGNRTKVTSPTGGVYQWTYDTRNRVSTQTDPLGNVTSYEYDAVNNLVRQVNANGSWVRSTYDPMNRPRRTERSDGTWTDRVYDQAGNVVRATTEKTVLTFSYDVLNRVTSETLAIKGTSFSRTVQYQYGNESELLSVTDPTGRVLSYGYNPGGQLTQVTSSTLGTMVQVTPDGYAQRGIVAYGNGRTATLAFDKNGRPTNIDWTAPIARFGYVRDAAGNPTTVTESLGGAAETLTVAYDTMNRPGTSTAAVSPGQRSETFAYDPSGNLTNPGNGVITTFNSANQPVGDSARTYLYDRQGCRSSSIPMVGAPVNTVHDADNRIVSIDDGSSLTRFTYDALDRPVEIEQGGVVARVVHALQNRIVEYNAAGTATALYTASSRIDDVFAVETGGSVYYAHTDAIGSVRAVTNSAGAVAGTRQFGMYGRQQATTGTPGVLPLGFAGRPSYLGGTLIDMRARLYDPRIGAFIAPDPLGVLSKFPNPYAYANNRPLMFVDPLGLSPEGPSWTNRLFGGLKLLGGLGETALGILGILAPDPTLLTKVGGGLLTAHGLDTTQSGLRQLWTGETTRSLTSLGLGAGAELLGASEGTAYYIGEFGDAGVGIVLTLGTAGAINAAGASARESAALAARADEIHGALDPIAQSMRTTAVLQTTEGNIIAGGGRDLTAAQKALLGPGEIAAKLPGAHAEVTALEAAGQLGATPQAMAVTRAICPSCQVIIQQAGGTLTSPTTVIFLVKP